MLSKERLRANLDEVIWNIEDARVSVSEHHIVKLVTVGKYNEVENIESLYHLGQRAFGENQVQQLEKRQNILAELPIEWHFLGNLQKNKINKLIEVKPSLIQSLNSIELALELNKKLEVKDKRVNCLLQINSSNNNNQFGVSPEMAQDLYQEINERCLNINLKGVMSIGANGVDDIEIKDSFETTYKIYESLKKDGAYICSMGMSGDYKLAIQCGSNLIRVGSALFR
ncbi:MAG: YggS family pyridoxal phosphate-dependent enzyme [Sulfurovum sp.]|nr:YggS family pyridoxal phosphate-dependent enzyme [Sulfurovaceae bacterium]